MHLFGHDLLALMSSHGYLLLFVVVLLEEAGVPIPIPGDLLLLFTGSLIAQGTLDFAPAYLLLMLATLIGTSILYTAAFRGGRPLLRRYGRWLRLKEERLARAEHRLGRRPVIGVAMLRLTPGLRVGSIALAGVLAVPRHKATISFVLSGMFWSGLWLGIGFLLGPNVNRAAGPISRIEGLVLPVVVAVVGGAGALWIVRRALRSMREWGWDLNSAIRFAANARRPRVRSVAVNAFAMALLLITPPLISPAHSGSERLMAAARERPPITMALGVSDVTDR